MLAMIAATCHFLSSILFIKHRRTYLSIWDRAYVCSGNRLYWGCALCSDSSNGQPYIILCNILFSIFDTRVYASSHTIGVIVRESNPSLPFFSRSSDDRLNYYYYYHYDSYMRHSYRTTRELRQKKWAHICLRLQEKILIHPVVIMSR
jgi:hypothetical protein